MRGLKNVVHIYNKTSFIHKKEASLVAQMAKNLPVMRETQVLFGKIPWRRTWQPTPIFLPRESFGQRSRVGYSPWGTKSWTWLKQLSTAHIKKNTCHLEQQMNEPGGQYVKWNNHRKTNTIWSRLHVKSKAEMIKSWQVVTRAWGMGEMGGCWSKHTSFQLHGEEVLGI